MLTFIDLFCGAGGMTQGMKEAGLRHVVGIDMDPRACATYAANHEHVLCADVASITYEQVVAKTKEPTVDVLVASPPCQSFSVVGPHRQEPDPKDTLFRHVLKFAEWFQPRVVLIENVPGLLKKGTVFEDIVHGLRDVGYDHVQWDVLHAEKFGVPQVRHRVFVVAMRSSDPGVKRLVFPPLPTPDEPMQTLSTILRPRESVQDPVYWMTPEKADYYRKRRAEKGSAYVRYINPSQVARTVRASYYKSRGAEALVVYEDGAVRLLTEDEVAACQAFPPTYRWLGSRTAKYTHIGNAVPPKLAMVLGTTLNLALQHLDDAGVGALGV